MSKKYFLKFVKNFISDQGGILLTNYISANSKIIVRCINNHIWETTFSRIKNRGDWCLFCSGKCKKTIEEIKQFAQNIGYEFLSPAYKNNKTIYSWKCDKGHIFEDKYNTLQSGCRCPDCSVFRREQTNLTKFGVTYPSKRQDIKIKTKQTNLERYGTEHALQIEYYFNKVKKTNLERYGVEFVSQNKDIALKSARNQNNSAILYHWKTAEELICVGSFEQSVIEKLNKDKQDFDWQVPFDMPDGRKYFCDLFLKNENLFVEIKGYKREKNMKKWFWFHGEYPNSELWDKEKLKELGIWKRSQELLKEK